MYNLSDIEYALVIAILGVLFFFSVDKRTNSKTLNGGIKSCLVIGKNMSTLVKAFCCVFILMGHYAARDINSGIATYMDKTVYMTTANIALVIFMFFSGYGLSVQNKPIDNFFPVLFSRLKKVYFPLLFIGFLYVIMCYLLPDVYSADVVSNRELPTLIHEFTSFNRDSWCVLVKYLLGYNDWYVVCIMYFYAIFYLSQWISNKMNWNCTIVLTILMLAYYVAAYYIYGMPQAHFFRYPCAFMIGHFAAKYNKKDISKKEKIMDIIVVLLFVLTVLFHGKRLLFIYAVATAILFSFSYLDKRYEVKASSLLFTLGTVSYFYYLSHGRICYTLMYYMGIDDLLFWTIFTGVISYVLWHVYYKVASILKCKK